jgi:hypothetical protein
MQWSNLSKKAWVTDSDLELLQGITPSMGLQILASSSCACNPSGLFLKSLPEQDVNQNYRLYVKSGELAEAKVV